MAATSTFRYDVVEHFRTLKELASYFEAYLVEANGDDELTAKDMGASIIGCSPQIFPGVRRYPLPAHQP